MDPVTLLISFGVATFVTFVLLLLERTNWGRSKRLIIYLVIFAAVAATGAYAWFAAKDMTIAAAVFLGCWLGQTGAKLLDDWIEHHRQLRNLNKTVKSQLEASGAEPVSLDVTPYRRTVVDSLVASSLKKGHEVGTLADPAKKSLTLSVRSRAQTPTEPKQ